MVRKHAAYLRALASVLIAVLRRTLWILLRVGFLLASRHFGRGVLSSSAAQGVSSFHVLGQPRTAPFSCTPRPSAAHCAHYRPPAMLAVRIPKEPLQSDSASRVWTLSSHERESGCQLWSEVVLVVVRVGSGLASRFGCSTAVHWAHGGSVSNLCRPSRARSRPARLLVSLPSHSMSRRETKALLALHFFAWVGWPSVVDETCSALSVVGGRASATPRQCCFFVALFSPASSLQFRGRSVMFLSGRRAPSCRADPSSPSCRVISVRVLAAGWYCGLFSVGSRRALVPAWASLRPPPTTFDA